MSITGTKVRINDAWVDVPVPVHAASHQSGGSDSIYTVFAPILALGPSDPVPAGTPAGTVIVRTDT